MTPHAVIAVSEASQVGEARRAAAGLAERLAFDTTQAGKVAIVVTELGQNLVRHATGGRLLLAPSATDPRSIDVLSVDDGPGMKDLAACLRDGYSTGGTSGNGFGAVKRLSDVFSAHSAASKGTVILSRISAGSRPASAVDPASLPFEVAGIALAIRGESVSGDAWAFRWHGGTVAQVVMADGLGHGPLAAEASDAAVGTFNTTTGPPSQMLDKAHDAMRHTRGAAVAMASLDTAANVIAFAGAGNIVGRLLSGVDDRTLMSQHGTVGVQVRKLVDVVYPWPPHACLILHSDGLTTRWNLGGDNRLLQCDPAVIAAWLIRDHSRGRDDVTVVVVRRR